MRYKAFRIQNFKGIKDTTVHFGGTGGPAVFAFVGLNESGKTTVLEAIHSFCPDSATSELLGGHEGLGVPFKKRVPRHEISTFTGHISVTATLAITDADKRRMAKTLKEKHDLDLDMATFPSEVVFDRQQRFENGDFKNNFFTLRTQIRVKTPKQRQWRNPIKDDLGGQESLIPASL